MTLQKPPKLGNRVYVCVRNPENSKDSKTFTIHGTTVHAAFGAIMGFVARFNSVRASDIAGQRDGKGKAKR